MNMDTIRAEADIVAIIGARITLTRRGREFVALCPFHEERTPSFYVIPDREFFHCFGCGVNGDVVAFIQRFDGVDFKAACAVVTGQEPASERRPRAGVRAVAVEPDWVTSVPPEESQRPASMATHHHGNPVAEWCYRTQSGDVLGYAAKYLVGDKKAILQWTYGKSRADTEPYWACRHFSKPRPLYGLETLQQADLPVVIVEGEKTAEAARLMFPNACVVTWPGGTSAVKHVDWTPLIGRDCIMIPDADKPGHEAGEWIAAKLTELDCHVQYVTPEVDRPVGWDLADEDWGHTEAMRWLNANCRQYPFTELAPHQAMEGVAQVATPPSAFSEDALAQQFIALHSGNAKYVKTWGQWMLWQETRWVRDEQDVVKEMARTLLCGIVNSDVGQVMQLALRRRINSIHMVNAVQSIASFSPSCSTAMSQWDSDPWLLSTPGGTVDLKTGEVRASRREDLMLQTTTVSPAKTGCPTWLHFLDTVMAGNQGLIDYLQRLTGYALTGLTIEQQLSFFYGTGGNGKGVFLSALRSILGEYATVAPMSTFVEKKNDGHPTDIAGLQSARLVVAQETEEGRRWAESLLKSLTGGDPVKARYMRQDYFEFIPKFKLIFAGNHKPALRSVDEAMRRRMHIVPWTVTIPAEQRDPFLGEKLKAEYPAILQWMIDGCLCWQQYGLAPPPEILEATNEYLEGEDTLSSWLDERCILDTALHAATKEVYQNYVAWCSDAKEFPFSHKRLVSNLASRGVKAVKSNNKRILRGIALKEVEPVVARW